MNFIRDIDYYTGISLYKAGMKYLYFFSILSTCYATLDGKSLSVSLEGVMSAEQHSHLFDGDRTVHPLLRPFLRQVAPFSALPRNAIGNWQDALRIQVERIYETGWYSHSVVTQQSAVPLVIVGPLEETSAKAERLADYPTDRQHARLEKNNKIKNEFFFF